MEAAIERVGMPLSGFLELFAQQPFELINGERKPIMPGVSGHSELIRSLFLALYNWSVEKQIGEVLTEATFVLSAADESDWVRGSRTPDVMILDAVKVAEWKKNTPDHKQKPYPIVPFLVIEVVSPNDRYSEIDEKVEIYLQDGVKLIWIIDPQRRKVTIHAPDLENPIVLKGDAVLDGGEILPGFQISLAKLFE